MSPNRSEFDSQVWDDETGSQAVIQELRSQLDDDGNMAMDYYFGTTPAEQKAKTDGTLDQLHQAVKRKEFTLMEIHAEDLGIPLEVYQVRLERGRANLSEHLTHFGIC